MAKEPTAKERIDYLVRRRFPHWYLLKIPTSFSLGGGGPPPDTRELRIAIEAFTKELAAVAPEPLVARWNEEKRKELEQLGAKAEQEERERFFNRPNANADSIIGPRQRIGPWTRQ
jgi:hypothetical protein